MKKRHLFGLFAMAAFTFVGCSQDEVVSQSPDVNKAIEFGTYVGRDAQSRGHVITIDTLAKEGFGVFAYHTRGNFVEGDDESTTGVVEVASTCNFMFNQWVHGKKGGTTEAPSYDTGVWEYTPLKYWPKNTSDKLTFFAYAPYEAGSAGNIILPSTAPQGVPSLTFNVDTDVEKHQDLLFTTPQKDKTNSAESVDFEFKHALARIGFKAGVSASLDQHTTITINSVKLVGKFYSQGTMSLENGTWTNQTSPTNDVTFELNSDATSAFETNNNVLTQANGTNLSQLNNANNYIMIIPQNFGSNTLKMIVDYDVVTDVAGTAHDSRINNKITSPSFGLNFVQGKAYSLNIVIGMAAVKFTATVQDWDEISPATTITLNTTSTTP